MNSQPPSYLTPDGKRRLEEELAHLETTRRQEISDRLYTAIRQGDLSENADYIQAKEEQAFLEGRIRDIQAMLRNVVLIELQLGGDVRIGSKITVTEDGQDERETFMMVGAAEANPLAGRISNESPLGQALMGRRVDDKVIVQAPAGQTVFTIVAIE
ncbi:MAG: transcription elongation factor GreA [Chloroflexi bacterium RBG_16_56_8]|nr:MAG: transcription elongation factor GreA [Chloroflexi bacterium RBG_16_56_8]